MKTLITIISMSLSLLITHESAWASSDSGLVTTLANETHVSQEEARKQVDAVVSAIKSELLAGHEITMKNFGKFYVSEVGPHEARNPKSGQKIQIEARRYPKFASSDTFKGEFRPATADAKVNSSAQKTTPHVAKAS